MSSNKIIIKKSLTTGFLHIIPKDFNKMFSSFPAVKIIWEDITPLAKNEWICWIQSAKKVETRDRRIKIMCENLIVGKRRPCCWAGCTHR